MDPDDTAELVRRVAGGDRRSLEELFARHRARLRRMVDLRLDPRVRGRVDASDVVQSAALEAYRRLDEYLQDRKLPFFLWLRFLTNQKVLELHRRHLGAQRRDARRDVHLRSGPWPRASSALLADQLSGKLTAPSQGAIRAERKLRLEAALHALEPEESDILVLRHYEQLTNAEAAIELGIQESAASKRYVRALVRLEGILRANGIDLDGV